MLHVRIIFWQIEARMVRFPFHLIVLVSPRQTVPCTTIDTMRRSLSCGAVACRACLRCRQMSASKMQG
eukprot:5847848-Pleurochrysis_carterae.AAC.1